jgi:hypothetical protein
MRNRLQHAGAIGAHFEVDLLGLEFDERLAGGDAVARLLQPLRDAGFNHRFAQFGNDDVLHRREM